MCVSGFAILLLVVVLLAIAFRPRAEPRRGDERTLVRVWIVSLGLGLTIVVLAGLLTYGLVIGERLLPHKDGAAVQVSAEGRRWSWRFAYADAPGRVTENVLHIPAGRPVDVAISTADVIHSFWVPRLAGKLDAVPGRVNVLRIEANRPGRYAGRSAEYSGAGYAFHRYDVVAHDAASWQRFLAGDIR